MKNENKKIRYDLIILITLFIFLFFIKTFLYNLIGDNTLIQFEKVFSFIPENVLFYLFLPIYYIFFFPIIWILGKFNLIDSGINQFYLFSLDILLTIIYLTILFFISKKLVFLSKKRTKK
jgi:hypothetical protein